jgi:hypothetical protein
LASSDRILLFLHLPKVGGATLNKIIFENCRSAASGSDEKLLLFSGVCWFPGAGFYKPRDLEMYQYILPVLRRPDLRAVVGHFWYGLHEYVPHRTVYSTMLRDPVERILSLYHHARWKKQVESSLEDFVATPPFREVDNDQTRRICGVEPDIGQCTPAMLEKAKHHLRRDFAVVGLTERFEETVLLLSKALGWTGELARPRGNVSRNRVQREELTASVRDRILERNALDVELYGYAAALMDEAIARQPAEFHDETIALRAAGDALSAYSYVG